MKPYTKIGCNAYIVRDGHLLLGLRGNVHGQGTWALPGGHLELQERLDECVARELTEEMGITTEPADMRLIAVTDNPEPEAGTHYVQFAFAVDIGRQEPQRLEPEACREWRWFKLDELPGNVYPPHSKIFATIASGQTYFSV